MMKNELITIYEQFELQEPATLELINIVCEDLKTKGFTDFEICADRDERIYILASYSIEETNDEKYRRLHPRPRPTIKLIYDQHKPAP